MKNLYDPIKIEADIETFEGSDELRKEAASIVKFPENKTPDVLFFSGIFVSSGENLNKAYFMPSELVKAYNTIDNKALDIEHDETSIIGHIYSSAFVDQSGSKLEINDLQDKTQSELDNMNMDVMIAGIIYKSRFPEIAEEVKSNKWKLSMETFFSDYDVKVGNVIMSRQEAESLGLASESVLGKVARILRKGKEVAKGEVARILRDLLFSGCGIVKQPANPRSIILETAKHKKIENEEGEIIIELEPEKESANEFTSPSSDPGGVDSYDLRTQTAPGICVSYKRRVIDATYEGPDAKVIHEDWCTLYDQSCTSPSRGADHPDCLRNKISKAALDYIESKLNEIKDRDKRGDLLSRLKDLL